MATDGRELAMMLARQGSHLKAKVNAKTKATVQEDGVQELLRPVWEEHERWVREQQEENGGDGIAGKKTLWEHVAAVRASLDRLRLGQ